MIPLILRLKKAAHREIAKAQDIIVATLYQAFDEAVLHGGTAIWRCYKGQRYSEDVDVYISKDAKKTGLFFEMLGKKGFLIEKKKIGEKSIYSILRFNHTVVRFEAIFKKANGSLKEYETAEGNLLTVYTLTAEELIREKAAAYLSRFKIRDLYDVFFLLRYAEDLSRVKPSLTELMKKFKEPADEQELKILIIEGLTPDTNKMLDYIKERI